MLQVFLITIPSYRYPRDPHNITRELDLKKHPEVNRIRYRTKINFQVNYKMSIRCQYSMEYRKWNCRYQDRDQSILMVEERYGK
jgi:hypothetical protein